MKCKKEYLLGLTPNKGPLRDGYCRVTILLILIPQSKSSLDQVQRYTIGLPLDIYYRHMKYNIYVSKSTSSGIGTRVLQWLQSVERLHVALDRSATTAG